MKKWFVMVFVLCSRMSWAQTTNDSYWNPNYRDSIRPFKEGVTFSFGMTYNNFTELNQTLRQNYIPEIKNIAPHVDFCAEIMGLNNRIIYQFGGSWQHNSSKGKHEKIKFDGYTVYNHLGFRLYHSEKFFTYYLTGIDFQANFITIKHTLYKTQTPSVNISNGHSIEIRYLVNKHHMAGTSIRTCIPLYKSNWSHYYQLYGEYPTISSFVFQTALTWTVLF